jgi:hypothetical protein
MKITATLHNLTESFYSEFELLTSEEQFRRLDKLRHVLPQAIKIKIETGQFRDAVDLNHMLKYPHTFTSKIESRRGYKLVTFTVEKESQTRKQNPIMATPKKPSPAQIAARKLFAARSKAGTLVKRKTNPLTRVGIHSKSMSTGKTPRKRLVERRIKTTVTPEGCYANPVKYRDTAKELRSDRRVGYSVHLPSQPGHNAIAWYSNKKDAVAVATEAANRTGKQLAVSRVQIYFGPD